MDTIGAISYVHEVKEHAHLRKWLTEGAVGLTLRLTPLLADGCVC